MGAFVLGVLVGWLIAWVYYTFWIKPNSNDCSVLEAELELKNKQISSLQTQISSATQSSESDNTSTKAAVAASKSSSVKASASKKSNSKKTSKASNSKKATTTNKSASNTKKTAVSKKPTTKKTTTAKKAKAGGDDFTKLSGIGPSMSAKLKSIGIDSYKKLAATDDNVLREKLEEAGARMNNNKDVMDSWNEQATLAAKGEFEALKKMQESLKK